MKTKICVRQKKSKNRNFAEDKKIRLKSEFSLGNTRGWGGRIKNKDNDLEI